MNPNLRAFANPTRRPGFTLVELLVVILIIVVLAAIVVPLAGKMRASSADSQCLNHLKSWSNVFAMYSSEHGGVIECRNWNSIGREAPSAYVTYWAGEESHEAGYRELAKMRCCPALKGADAISGNGNSLTAYSLTDASGVASSNAKEAQYSLAKIKNPSRFVMMVETTGGSAFIRTVSDYTTRVKPLTLPEKMRHKGSVVNAIFGDFSVRSLTWKEIEKDMGVWTSF